MTLAVSCKQIKKVYRQGTTIVNALRGIDLEIFGGELLMLVGPSGCGKTTLLSIISGILNQDSGSCKIYGTEINKLDEQEKTAFRGREIGFVFQAFNLIPMLSALENTAVPLLLNDVPKIEALEKAEELLIKVGLKDRLHLSPRQLSGGEQQRVAIARGCIHGPKLIVCDEPTSALDHETGEKVLSILREVTLNKDRALIIVTHDARIFHFADRIAKMDDGLIGHNQTQHKSTDGSK